MKMRLLTTIIAMTLLSDTFGQVSGYEFARADLKGNKRVTSTRTNYYGRDSSTFNSVYIVNELGDIVKSEHYDGKELTSWAKYEYYDNGLLKFEENHNQVFKYDDKLKKHIGQIEDDTYNGKILEYSDKLLMKETYVHCFDGSKSYDFVIFYEYDNLRRPIKKASIDGNIGLRGEFKSNSSILDTLYRKDQVTKLTTIYEYKADSIISTDYGDNNEIRGYKLTKLGANKRPINIIDTDPQKNGITSITRTYDNRGNLTRQTIEIIDIDKITGDIAAGDEYELFYNEKTLPVLCITKENGKIISREIVRYK